MNPYRSARNQTLVALSAADEATHLVTEAALDSEAGLPVDKGALLASLNQQQAIFDQQIQLAIKLVTAAA